MASKWQLSWGGCWDRRRLPCKAGGWRHGGKEELRWTDSSPLLRGYKSEETPGAPKCDSGVCGDLMARSWRPCASIFKTWGTLFSYLRRVRNAGVKALRPPQGCGEQDRRPLGAFFLRSPEQPAGFLGEGLPAGSKTKRGGGRARPARCTLGTLVSSRWRATSGRAEGRVPSNHRPPRAVMRGWRATYPPRRVYVADLVTDYGREEVGTQSPTAAAQATRRPRPHVAPTSALMRLSRPLRRREQKTAQAADRTGASSPALPSPTPTAS
ncbi:hypothetical protein HispidOSU_011067 [Sigmodon hispidus]